MMRRYIYLFGLCFSSISFAGSGSSPSIAKDLYLGEAYYHALQDDYFDAITLLDIRLGQFHSLKDPKTNPLHIKINNAQFTLGDFEMSYRMPLRASQTIKPILTGNIDQSIRLETNYRLASIYQKSGDPGNALIHIENITGRIPSELRDDELSLRAQVYMATGNPELAIKTLRKLQGAASYEGFSSYNLGIALIQNMHELEGLAQLDETGQIKSNNEGVLAIKDRANLILGDRLISSGQPALAKQYLDRVRLTGPFSNVALLGSGMADVAIGKFESALVPWSILLKRNVADRAVQESMLGVPFAYSSLELHGRAALFYESALEKFGAEHDRLDTSIKGIREGRLLKTLRQNELIQDKNWIVILKKLPETPETHYLPELIASHDFRESLENYLDLNQLLKKLEPWDGYLNAFEGIIQARQHHYEADLPNIDKQFAAINSRIKLLRKQRQALDERLKAMSVRPQPELLETADESIAHEKLRLLTDRYKNDFSESANETRQLIKQDEEILQKAITSSYDKRLAEAKKQALQLDDDLDKLRSVSSEFEISRHAVIQSYRGYDNQIKQLRNRIKNSRGKANSLLEKQGQMLEMMATNELEQRRDKLQEFRVVARFALSESYDRASKKQLDENTVK